eukprot:2689342-Prorocentrum_lima.AAC.1
MKKAFHLAATALRSKPPAPLVVIKAHEIPHLLRLLDFLRMGRWDQAARLLPVLPSLRDHWDSDALPLLAG